MYFVLVFSYMDVQVGKLTPHTTVGSRDSRVYARPLISLFELFRTIL